MRGCFKAIAAFGMVAALAGPAMAQGRGGYGGEGGGANLIGNPGIQKELKLDDDQVKKAREVAQDFTARMQDARSSVEGLEGDARMKKIQELSKIGNDEALLTLGTFLKPEQLKRFKQIRLQQRGANAMTDPAIVSALKVTDDQAEKVKAIIADSRTEMREAQESAAGDRQAAMQKFNSIRKESSTKVMALMTDDQKKAWKEMTGEPYEVIYAPRPPR